MRFRYILASTIERRIGMVPPKADNSPNISERVAGQAIRVEQEYI